MASNVRAASKGPIPGIVHLEETAPAVRGNKHRPSKRYSTSGGAIMRPYPVSAPGVCLTKYAVPYAACGRGNTIHTVATSACAFATYARHLVGNACSLTEYTNCPSSSAVGTSLHTNIRHH